MKNAVGRDIPEEFLTDGVEVYQGLDYRQDYDYQKATPKTRANVCSDQSKLVSLKEAIEKTGLKDGMTISFHHHFRNGDYTMPTVMKAIHEMGIKDLYVCASSLGKAAKDIVPMIEDGTITRISSSGVRDEVGEAISTGKLKHPAMIRTHGGRVRAIETGQVHIDVAFIGAPSSDELGNASGKGGRSDCGVLSYANVDAEYADKVVVLTDTLVPTPNHPASISSINVDYVVEIDEVGDPAKIASGAIRLTDDPRELKIAKSAAEVVVNTPYFEDGYTFQTGAGGSSLAVTRFLKPYMDAKGIKMGWALGGITEPMVNLLKEGYIGAILDTQDFDTASVASVHETPNHFEISTSEYANPFNKGAYVNYLDYVILGALEVDTDFNVNVVQGSDGMIQGAPGGHPDTSAGAKVTIIVTPLVRSRIPSIKDRVTSVTTPGESVDVLVTDNGIAVNPKRQDLIDSLEAAGVELTTIEALKEKAYDLVGTPKDLEFEDEVVALVEYRDGTIIDTIKKIKR
ncbi:citrate lyase subunit alpha [Aerococcus sanguinicola]|uniref:citrate lyase subunit alpha n=1 Tax=unclassified Aerococcus TaxID=2618060 RepID=UPI0008A12ED1|nr:MULTISPECIES: citrate lyase subunit alpha [unclassified Aerococcus]KAB0646784.1 citrate lyase subunit alpha [Aerococcus sanguinicola]MDK6234289.1 citrate lyase subunit alpha [Aerococcus sp. UMB10185]MDK6804399.1 citrate lyase subunit alpha [Aerococcus sp. UMB7834]MDK6855487.1 citrate lyase subunit alpha [Aerococcus sp. UMB7533]MDK8503280.1 citrate lyase subunit alpha [Aerococcus sp. UMB1112A]